MRGWSKKVPDRVMQKRTSDNLSQPGTDAECNGIGFEADKGFETRAKRYTLWAGQRAGERCGEGG